MPERPRITINLNGRVPEDLELIQTEMRLGNTDAVGKAISLLALILRRQNEGYAPAFVRPDGSVQEIYIL